MDTEPPYSPIRPGRQDSMDARGLRMQLHHWPAAGPQRHAPLVLLHGWMDCGASFQFVVDELHRLEGAARTIVAPDWRGFGLSQGGGGDSYWFPDYLADLDALLQHLAPRSAVDLLGHSMGGNVAMLYAGVRPQRVRRLVNVEGFGLPESRPDQAPERLRQWLDELQSPVRLRSYPTLDEVATRIADAAPRLGLPRARWLAAHWATRGDDARWHLNADPAHTRVNPILYRKDEVLATWRRIEAPLSWVEGGRSDPAQFWGSRYTREDFEARLAVVPKQVRLRLPDCGHMVHQEQAAALAAHLHDFLH